MRSGRYRHATPPSSDLPCFHPRSRRPVMLSSTSSNSSVTGAQLPPASPRLRGSTKESRTHALHKRYDCIINTILHPIPTQGTCLIGNPDTPAINSPLEASRHSSLAAHRPQHPMSSGASFLTPLNLQASNQEPSSCLSIRNPKPDPMAGAGCWVQVAHASWSSLARSSPRGWECRHHYFTVGPQLLTGEFLD
jgi:hypothetical protein